MCGTVGRGSIAKLDVNGSRVVGEGLLTWINSPRIPRG
jgi:hypothetical protein